jgi:amino-acid N-acetyltransferase
MKAQLITKDDELTTILQFLQDNGLPHKDITLEKTQIFSYNDHEGALIGSGGLEFYGAYALLRSVAVRKDLRGKSIGKLIVEDLLDKAKQKSTEVYLLTETAHEYFKHLKFQDVDRKSVPKEIQSSSEFSNVCPSSAACMVFKLKT